MSREVPWNANDRCDGCGKLGAYDFMGDCFCDDCIRKANKLHDQAMTEPTQRDPNSVYCDVCGAEVTTGLMAVFCPLNERCEFWPDDEASIAFIHKLRAAPSAGQGEP